MKVIAIDTETTGLDLRHGAKPFFVTTYDGKENGYWEWPVDPLTRGVSPPPGHVRQIQSLLDSADEVVLHNAKFDSLALSTIGVSLPREKVHDTLVAGHLLSSNTPHNLTDMLMMYCRRSIQRRETRLEDACKKARSWARTRRKDWRIAKKGDPTMPSLRGGDKEKAAKRGSEKDSAWKYDSWLPKLLAETVPEHGGKGWESVLEEYANDDSAGTWLLWDRVRKHLDSRRLWKHYRHSMELLWVVEGMEWRGVTVSKKRMDSLSVKYRSESEECERKCVAVAQRAGYEGLVLPKAGRNKSLDSFLFDHLKLPAVAKTESGKPGLSSACLGAYRDLYHEIPDLVEFFTWLKDKRSRDTAQTYMKGYERFWHRAKEVGVLKGWYRLFPNFNMTGTDTLRFSSSNPNAQNISKKKSFNLRYCFGPLPGREWWALDYENLELRLPAYKAGEPAMIDLFENPGRSPFFGSYHMLVFSILHPKMWQDAIDKVGIDKASDYCKEEYKSTWYSWTKNGNFAVQYGAQETSGTADRAYHVKGAQAIIQNRFTNIKRLNHEIITHANKYGFVYTMPSKFIDPDQGYPLLCTRTDRGGILPTVPLSYYIQGTAMQCTRTSMVRCQGPLDEWTEATGLDHFMTLQVHDEIVFDLPKGKTPRHNLKKVMELKRLMELSGDDIGVPLKVSVSYHPNNWSESVDYKTAV